MTYKRLVFLTLCTGIVGAVLLYSQSRRAEVQDPQPSVLVSDETQSNNAESIDLNRVIERAEKSLAKFRKDIQDFTARMTKRERVNGKLLDSQSMQIKILCRQYADADKPMSKESIDYSSEPVSRGLHAYLRFLSPSNVAGREVIWIEGKNDNKLIAHEAGFLNVMSVHLDPNGTIAMVGSKYPVTEIGLEKLLVKLIERGRKSQQLGESSVTIARDAQLDSVTCDRIRIVHAVKKDGLDFHIAEVWIDPLTEIPLYYASYDWPATPAEEPPLIEEYSYRDLKTNVGLSEKDFDPKNSEYKFP